MIKSSWILAASAALCITVSGLAGLPDFPLVPGEVIIRTTDAKALAAALTQLSAQFQNVHVINQIAGRHIYLVSYSLSQNQDANTMHAKLDAMTASGALVWGELNYVGQTGEGNTDSLWLSGVGADSISYFDQYPTQLLGLGAAHQASTGAGVVVSVIDNGIDATHPVFNGHVSTLGVSFVPGSETWSDTAPGVDTDGDGRVDEQYGHGTFVAGLIHLVAPDAMILSARALDSNGQGNNFRIAQAVAWSIDRGAHVINMSLGETYHSIALSNMVLEAKNAGIVVTGAAGNQNAEDPRQYPACDLNAYGVTAFNWNDVKAPFSNYEVRMDLAAPGDSDIVGGVPNMARCIIGPVPGAAYAVWEGTSFANAFVSGTIALVRAQRPEWPNKQVPPASITAQVRTNLVDSGIPIHTSNPNWQGKLGDARIHAGAAVLQNPQAPAFADLNADGAVNAQDIAILLDAWGSSSRLVRSDLNADGVVNAQDIAILLTNW